MDIIRMAYRNFRKMGKKVARYAKKRYLRKGAGYNTGLRMNKIIQDVKMIKDKLNTEKKYIDDGGTASVPVGQQNVNGYGNQVLDITPINITQGVGYSQRVGKSIKLVAMSLQYQMEQQSATSGPRTFYLYICKTNGAPQLPATLLTNFMAINPITAVYDTMSNRNINYFKDYVVLKRQKITMKPDSVTGQTQLSTGRCVMKLNHHIQFVDNTNTVSDGQLFWYIVADAGNAGAINTTTLPNVAIPTANTGASLQTYVRYWYVDN